MYNFTSGGLMIVKTDYLELTDSDFFRGKGGIFITFVDEGPFIGHIRNVTFQAMFSHFSIFMMASNYTDTITLTNCRFIDNHSNYPVFSGFGLFIQDRMLYRNNRITRNWQESVCSLPGKFQLITNSVFENNGAYDSTFEVFWADYYLDKGLLNEKWTDG